MISIFSCAYWPSIRLLWRNVYLGVLPIFWVGFFFLLLNCMNCLYILEIKPLSVSLFANNATSCLYVVFWFCVWFPLPCKSLSLIRSYLSIFAHISLALGDWPKKMLVQFMSENVLPMFFSGSFMMSCLISKTCPILSLFLCVAWRCVLTSLIDTSVQLSQHHLLKACLSPTVYSCFLCQRLIDHRCVGLFLSVLFCCTDPYVCFCIWCL